ncbi:unnamed protein product [Periconia digitata]|uniref:Uncharacterized protein n=1 Tax=Periconia digitata TaxID=1303443 RepID=A0A9W4XY67_9PLEO|nr:unnamed protein product [Periconia digitata]
MWPRTSRLTPPGGAATDRAQPFIRSTVFDLFLLLVKAPLPCFWYSSCCSQPAHHWDHERLNYLGIL